MFEKTKIVEKKYQQQKHNETIFFVINEFVVL